ncbi:MAG: response regulator [Leptothrix sp. (in: b-proteobacteria)]
MNAGSAATTISVVLADDHRLMREGLRRVLEATPDVRVQAEAADGEQTLEVLQRHPVHVLVLDLSMPGLSGAALIERVKSLFPEVAVLVLTMHADVPWAVRAFRAGASGYLTKDRGGCDLVQAIRAVAAGGGYVSSDLAGQLARGLHRPDAGEPHHSLSEREMQILRRLVSGQRPSDVAATLNLSIKTVSTHKTRIMEKLGLDSTAALIRYGLEHHLVDDV